MLPGMELDAKRVSELSGESQMLATDLADYLVGKAVPFREAHGVVRELCRHCEKEGLALAALPIKEYKRFSPHFERDIYEITAASSAAARDNPGGTAPERVAEALAQAEKTLEDAGDGF